MIIASVNWTVVLPTVATAATAIAVAVIGYLATRQTATSANRAADLERERFADELHDRRRAERREAYGVLLQAERSLALQIRESGPEDAGRYRAFHDALNIVVLISPTEVSRRAVAFNRTVVRARIANEDNPEGATIGRDWFMERRSMVDAMRADVAADGLPVEWEDESDASPSTVDPDE